MSPALATAIGSLAILSWGLLALFTAATGAIPPFQLNAMCFAIGGALGLAVMIAQPHRRAALRQSWRVYAFGIGGLFGFHALFFAALKLAPPAEATLINYLWPLLIVLFSGLLPDERLRSHHCIGAVIGFGGVVVLSGGDSGGDLGQHWPGYLCAMGSALFWSGYSVLSRRFTSVPTDAVTGFCIGASLLGIVTHLAFETTIWPEDTVQWAAVLALGLGPVGAAFYAWDIGCKRGDIRLLGVGAYSAPVISTFTLILAGFAQASMTLWVACFLIVAGALVASQDKLRRRPAGAR
ncbi:MAG: Permeases of the drug/metabolite transporter (DMT) superfamily [Saliniramus fredricksonii]|uniref:Permease of the drug/metabolite transporter (DMT) superfamily n=1 Tax=Saliniramus fredricksonii TaxID=1653334 RepID=A0A0P7ZWZ8_9HYPH|nr:EamA family transporter [Saliniramus fredricksonii]KPQ09357.1 MAG: Permeases of the drug/metabolite transporter (DMT) superfamily [Saliniramus fredricksonii]SCC79036.1 Permease of the drug/metabolite transporter (DMT) superfamily [Saliniramus fredricksonii]